MATTAFEDLTFQDLQTTALAYSGDVIVNQRYPAQVKSWINYAQKLMCAKVGIQAHWKSETVVNQRTYPMPKGWTKIKVVLFNGTPLRYCDTIDQDFFDKGMTTYCDRYSIWGENLFLGASPPAGPYSLDVYYYREPLLLSDPNDHPEVPNRFRQALADFAGARIGLADENKVLHDTLMAHFEHEKNEFWNWVNEQSIQMQQVRNVTDGWTLWAR